MAFRELVQAHPLLSALAVLLLTAWSYHVFLVTALPTEPPLIKGFLPFLGVGPTVLLNPRNRILKYRSQYGEIFTIYAFGLRITFMADPVDGVPAVFRAKLKNMSFRAALRTFFIKVLGMTPERADDDQLNKEHYAMIPPLLLSTSAVNGLTDRFVGAISRDIAGRAIREGFQEGKVVDLQEWIGARLFFNSAAALYGKEMFDDADHILRDFRIFDKEFPKALMLPSWMSGKFTGARSRIQKFMGDKCAQGLTDPSEFTKRRTEARQPFVI
jgi:hypothetical protein